MKRVHADVVVIGTGAGGGTVAQTLAPLADAGKRVLVLERGRRVSPAARTGRELEMAAALYAQRGGFGVDDHTVTLAFAECFGGSTLVYTGTSLPPPERIVEGWGLPALTHGDLVARCRRFMDQNNVHCLPKEALNDNNRLFRDGCRRLGWQPRQFPVNVAGCRGSSLCNLGCPNDAKQGTAQVQLPAAESRGVEVVTGATVTAIAERRLAVQVTHDADWPPGAYEVHADTVVLAAGAIRSPALLLASGYGRDLPALGRYWTCQPAQILVGEHPEPITNAVGHPKSFLWDERLESERFFLEVCMYFPFVTAKSMAGFGPDHERFMRAYGRLQMILVLACDDARPEHRVWVDRGGGAHVDYRLTRETIAALVRGTRAAARVFFAAGARYVHAPCARPMRIAGGEGDGQLDRRIQERHFRPGSVPVSAAHLMGGCRMGRDRRSAVTDAWGRVHGHPWLFVADASLFPSALEANPYLTVMALAERAGEAALDHAGGHRHVA